MLKCKIAYNHDHGSDHFPIRTIIATDLEEIETEPRYKFQQANWKKFDNHLANNLAQISLPRTCKIEEEIDQRVEELTEAIQKAIEVTIPRKKPCPHSKRWWNEKIMKL